ncbi:hypothetical protein PHJA_001331600 [Phtheirospermum japonicum]|uniref:S-protein homolog n=1 Tax=Phtheirospermum japonicum TaxID=374723 RepID=A0A830C6F4_9LAMI|nr:hypothetical protein PHJA_001331500 [Phtheirospermum japonicum]GFP91875.1 hypothetical protein PHJA_001331600 [Phtheirospermum japonicum]
MLIKTTIIYLALSFLLSTNLFHGTNSCFLRPKFHVGFYNRLPANIPKPLFVHCKSKDDNLGNHTLMPGQSWGFSFCDKFLSTLFICELHWNGLYRNNIVAFNAKWFFYPCDGYKCIWTVSASGATLPKGDFHYWENLPPMFGSIS